MAFRLHHSKTFRLCLPLALLLHSSFSLCAAAARSKSPNSVDFNREIRPILSENCYACHGPDANKRKAGLRLDIRTNAISELKSGNLAIVPGKPSESKLLDRITNKDDDERMPPPKTGKHLAAEQIETLRRWIEQGAEYKQHWAFIAPERPELPMVKNSRWPRNAVDDFILARLEKSRFAPEMEADKPTLIRRVTFDLTGLPPTVAEVDAFLADDRPDAYERLVDRLLSSPRYGEHMARYWLDVARYGDTHGLHLDNERSMWPYRDWVVNAFNRNEPFDRFTIEQLAGDLLPDPSQDQKVASGFNRCNVSTSEGGAIDEEFYVRYAVDRTEATAGVWMGLTVGCAVCHDHKYDPISQKEFYQLYAFFNNVSEKAMDGNALLPPPVMKIPTAEQKTKLAELNAKIGPTEQKIREMASKVKYKEPEKKAVAAASQPAGDAAGSGADKVLVSKPAGPTDFVWVDDDFPAGAKGEVNGGTPERQWIEGAQVYSGTRALTRRASGLAQDFFTGASHPLIFGKGDKIFAYVYLDPANPPKAIMLQYYTSEWLHRANWGDEDIISYGTKGTSQKFQVGPLPEAGKWVRLEVDADKLDLKAGAKVDGMAFTQFGGTVYWDKAGIVTATPQEDMSAISELAWEQQEKAKDSSALPRDILDAIKLARGKRSKEQTQLVHDYYIAYVYAPEHKTFEPYLKEIAGIKKQRDELDNSVPATMVMEELKDPRAAYILKRGDYDKREAMVTRAVPAVLPKLAAEKTTNRLDLARWLVSKEHPLTARVTVNRLWQQFFGTGLVKTANDFGSQGEFPINPELLDWLACEFRDGSDSAAAWDSKHMVRLLVTSSAYRQSSRVTPRKYEFDPENRFVSRGPRFRLDAEMIRDNALYVSGLLVEKMGGRGVRPYQPEGIWEAVGYTASNTAKFSQDHGEALYRRSLYTFWKRTAPPPSLITFDAPSRERFCTRRERTDTPLQALVTMNDVQFVEAARHFGERLIENGDTAEQRLEFGFQAVTSRHPSKAELQTLSNALIKFEKKYEANPAAAAQLISVGESPVNKNIKAPELAAYTMAASLLLNLDETLNKN
jgi:hypothetical protein